MAAVDDDIGRDTERDPERDTVPDSDEDDLATESSVMPIEPDEPAKPAGARLPNALLAVGVALVVAATAIAVWFGVTWISAGTDDGLEFSRERDEVNQVAQHAITTINTLDYKDLDAGLKRWETVTAGALHEEVVNRGAESKQVIEQAKSVTVAEVPSSAVTELNVQTGTATVVAALKLTVTAEGGQPEEKWMRMQGQLIRTGDGWKLEGIGQVPYSQAVPE